MMKKDTKSLLWGALVGSVVGSVTALLFAPKPGKELRKDIAEGTSVAVDKVQEIASATGEKTTELYGKAKDAVGSVVTEVKEWGKHYTSSDEIELVTVSAIAAPEAAELDEAGAEAEADIVAEAEADAEIGTAADVEAVLEDDTQNDKGGSGIL
ncbi:YtxH domain-containing protein [Paenibacillus sp. BAC0078]